MTEGLRNKLIVGLRTKRYTVAQVSGYVGISEQNVMLVRAGRVNMGTPATLRLAAFTVMMNGGDCHE